MSTFERWVKACQEVLSHMCIINWASQPGQMMWLEIDDRMSIPMYAYQDRSDLVVIMFGCHYQHSGLLIEDLVRFVLSTKR